MDRNHENERDSTNELCASDQDFMMMMMERTSNDGRIFIAFGSGYETAIPTATELAKKSE